MSEKNINFDDKKNQKSEFYKSKKVNSIDDIDVNKILVSKIIHQNTLLDTMIIMLLDHYV